MFRTIQFEKLLDKVTSNLRLEPDWPTIMQICDLIRQGDVQPKAVLAGIKKKLASPNPHTALFTLQVLESCVKNCGSLIQEEIGTKAYMEQLREIAKTTPHDSVKAKILELLQAWAFAFRNIPKYRVVQDTVNIMKTEGYKFPVMKESDAMFVAEIAPEWADGQCCHRCRVQFSVVLRKHHCRACGQIFCNQCTSKNCTLPKFGIEKEVRVCETCYEKFAKPSSSVTSSPASSKSEDLPVEYIRSSLAQQSQTPPPRKTDEELKEEEELQLAIALSRSEAECKNQRVTHAPVNHKKSSYSPPPQLSSSPPEDPDLARYLNRGYWQNRHNEAASAMSSNTPSAPVYATVNKDADAINAHDTNNLVGKNRKSDDDSVEMDEFIKKLKMQIEIFVNRMKSNSSRGRSIANDSSVQTLFMNITDMHSQLLQYVKKQDDKRVYYEGLQDKLTQVRDARAALDALREERREALRREAEQAERLRQIQMAHKLDIMRKKKQEYLLYQRQLALQRIQEQEREMQLRQEQQKQMNMRTPGSPSPYVGYYQPPPPGYDPSVGVPPPFNSTQVYPPQSFHGGMMGGHEYMMGPGGMPIAGMPVNSMPPSVAGMPMAGMGGMPPDSSLGPQPPPPHHHHQLISPIGQAPTGQNQPPNMMMGGGPPMMMNQGGSAGGAGTAPQMVPPQALMPGAPPAAAPPPQGMMPGAPQAGAPPQGMMPGAPQVGAPPPGMMPGTPQQQQTSNALPIPQQPNMIQNLTPGAPPAPPQANMIPGGAPHPNMMAPNASQPGAPMAPPMHYQPPFPQAPPPNESKDSSTELISFD